MPVEIVYPYVPPDFNSPDTLPTRLQQLFSWVSGQLLTDLAGIDASDVVSVQDSPADDTAGRVLLVGASATVLSASPALRASYGGSANAITLTTGASLASIPTGFKIRFRATSSNTGATTIDVDGTGAVAAKTVDESTALPSGYIRTDVDTEAYYNGAIWVVDRVVERGSNANGDYQRSADGLQTCWNQNSALQGNASANVTVTLPAAFVDNNYTGFAQSSDYAGTLRVGSVAGYSTTSFLVSIFDDADTRQTDYFRWSAKGRWY
ncbi:hypothetical protein TG4357_03745 [Thalassovita gelatinovora]|uniref:Uncharacterized protein n=1 Tax=Thalassovita gelatinovora TaxID=53501 RepID=A0A0P1G5T9_THAGE|nr:hypothetical protein [Thalassovita gelatinovora]QIZ79079.1 hypothetical protein HFZ77_00600 [Thalassovita gelatinovora]CUH68700.1 hypothetical protein TG4357_03745 [Thalassovita gelatinovora]SEQ56921.1 hypothetical protein SAMN04488043_106206 [Thalassovita gelatinovora]